MSSTGSTENLHRNAEHYDHRYGAVQVDAVVAKLRDVRAFLDDQTRTGTSWHGFYLGDFAARLPGARVLELGCGDGINALAMAALGAHVVANDISAESGRIVREAAARLGLEERVTAATGDFMELPFEPGAFDFVVGKMFLHHLTHEQEEAYVARSARLLKPGGEARWVEPAVNSTLLDRARWIVPVPGRPSVLARRAFAAYEAADPHPKRDNSSRHYAEVGRRFFREVEVVPIGSLERFCRLLPQGRVNRAYRRWAHRAETRLPMAVRLPAARAQLVAMRGPLA